MVGTRRLGLREIFGLVPWDRVRGDTWYALRGPKTMPRTRFNLSTLRIIKPRLALATWLGRRRADRRVPIYNFFNRVPAPKDAGYSVRITFARDWRGGQYTYDSHLGTDFAVPVGTPVVAAAPGLVVRVANDYDRGGLKVCLDHGDGLFTTSNHLARAVVAVGSRVGRGEVVGLSGASGIEFFLGFPWLAPHLHFNTWLNGEPTDPFARVHGDTPETPLWIDGPLPHPFAGGAGAGRDDFEPTVWDADAVEASINSCRDPRYRARMQAVDDPVERAAELLIQRNYRSSAFVAFPPLYPRRHPRRPRLDLPFRAADYVGVFYPGGPSS